MFHCRSGTYKLLVLTTVCDGNVWLSGLVEDLEGEVLDIRLHFGIVKLATNKTLGIENATKDELIMENMYCKVKKCILRVVRIHSNLVLCGIANETPALRERDVGRGRAVTLVIGNDLNTIILPDTDTA